MDFLIVGLGNKGLEYKYTRHNIGFLTLDMMASKYKAEWKSDKLADRIEIRIKNKKVVAIKPNTYMNLSGKAYKYWLEKLKLPMDKSIAIVDDLDLGFGQIRIKTKGNSGGHNGLKDIEERFNTIKFPRLRVGIDRNFAPGQQVKYVLSNWSDEEVKHLPQVMINSIDALEECILGGFSNAMNKFN